MMDLFKILSQARRIAVVGASAHPHRPSHQIMHYLMSQGYEVIPVNPHYAEVLGQPCYPSVQSLPQSVDIVNVFRRAPYVEAVVDDVLASGQRPVIWTQLGAHSEAAQRKAERARLRYIPEVCIMVVHRQWRQWRSGW
ncbi:MAG: CoA-binding protein [Bacteroidetes bacterium]|nr:CoA-binding protein [Rhodothermia bacterium]MCS7155775.1 CoA-binding protein [Bacteroidota bacterium]MCX7906124.1 CoA-binding protein [Bacteroidota bacterium]MDW8138252.1 CoA-binding protein [Bacteroidota bacterium]MDW8285936.1 CoA-binding protein [Bacteroidota bacterium]